LRDDWHALAFLELFTIYRLEGRLMEGKRGRDEEKMLCMMTLGKLF
jgi:hypothetical protein